MAKGQTHKFLWCMGTLLRSFLLPVAMCVSTPRCPVCIPAPAGPDPEAWTAGSDALFHPPVTCSAFLPVLATWMPTLQQSQNEQYFVFFHLNRVGRKVHLVPSMLPEGRGWPRVSFSRGISSWAALSGLHSQDLHLFSLPSQQCGEVEQDPSN